MPTVIMRIERTKRSFMTVAVPVPDASDPMDKIVQENAISAAKKHGAWVDEEDNTYTCRVLA